jgi:hypothetical protein
VVLQFVLLLIQLVVLVLVFVVASAACLGASATTSVTVVALATANLAVNRVLSQSSAALRSFDNRRSLLRTLLHRLLLLLLHMLQSHWLRLVLVRVLSPGRVGETAAPLHRRRQTVAQLALVVLVPRRRAEARHARRESRLLLRRSAARHGAGQRRNLVQQKLPVKRVAAAHRRCQSLFDFAVSPKLWPHTLLGRVHDVSIVCVLTK